MSTVDNEQRLVDQLRAEASIKRIKVSIACKDLIKYCQKYEAGDKLLPSKSCSNKSFREKRRD
jgi:hypothetical protein